jgi:hypothetical protein
VILLEAGMLIEMARRLQLMPQQVFHAISTIECPHQHIHGHVKAKL